MREIKQVQVSALVVCKIELEVLLYVPKIQRAVFVPKHYIRDAEGNELTEDQFVKGQTSLFNIDDWFCREVGITCTT